MIFQTFIPTLRHEEIFLNYGEYYWKDLEVKPVRVNNVKILNRAVDDLERKVQKLEREKKILENKLKGSRKTIEAYKKLQKGEKYGNRNRHNEL